MFFKTKVFFFLFVCMYVCMCLFARPFLALVHSRAWLEAGIFILHGGREPSTWVFSAAFPGTLTGSGMGNEAAGAQTST